MSRCRSPGPSAPASPGNPRPCPSARCCAAPRWPPWSRHRPRCARPSPDPPRRSEPEPSRRSPCGPHGAGARGSVTARNGPAHDPGFLAVETPVATGNPSSAIPARAQSRCPRSSPPGACGNSAPAAPKAPPAWPRNRTDRPPRRSCRNRPRSVPTADGRKTHDPASAASPPSLPSSPPDDPSAVPSSSANPRSNQNVKESDQAACVQCRLRQRAVNLDLEDFFPTFHFGRVRGFFLKDKEFQLEEQVATTIAQIACDGVALPQGSPCSPVISELIGQILDLRLLRFAKKYGVRYSRYADDITFSTNQKHFPVALAVQDSKDLSSWTLGNDLVHEIEAAGFKINTGKTRMHCRGSRQMVAGLVVNEKANIRSEYYRKARAMCDSLFQTGTYFRSLMVCPRLVVQRLS